ncbi:hypothetical protein CPS_2257 [Colwellia psychrerythraea 34H]|uniref:Uncharacterized protein n=1 Tax=Colwellia psychrerythraea (strain 34H / ATCC BAA-681) TaxID=167879 RepID=Q482N5_COLP3|nr:hypothetical protein CPS_2257 [Colwellia psychrerythraea 34H]
MALNLADIDKNKLGFSSYCSSNAQAVIFIKKGVDCAAS